MADEFTAHEFLDRSFVISELFEKAILDHSELEVRPDLKVLADEIAEKLGDLYQLAGQVDQRPRMCRFRLHDEGKAHPKSSCYVKGCRGVFKPRACETEPAQAEETKDT